MVTRTPEEKLVEALVNADNADAVRGLIEAALQDHPEWDMVEIAKQATTKAILPRNAERATCLDEWLAAILAERGGTMAVEARPTSDLAVAHLLNQMYQAGSTDDVEALLPLIPQDETDRAKLVRIASSSARQMFGPQRGEQVQTWFQGDVS